MTRKNGITNCKYCGNRIIYVETPSGGAIACNVPLVGYIPDPEGQHLVVTARGRVIRCWGLPRPDSDSWKGRVPHFQTHPQCGRPPKKEKPKPPEREAAQSPPMPQLSLF